MPSIALDDTETERGESLMFFKIPPTSTFSPDPLFERILRRINLSRHDGSSPAQSTSRPAESPMTHRPHRA